MSLPGYDKLIEITQGDDADVDIWYRAVPLNQRVVSATLVIKQNANDPNGAALFRTQITTSADGDGNQVLADGASNVAGIAYRGIGTVPQGTALMHWLLTADFVSTLQAGRDYFYGVAVRSSAGRRAEPEHGVIRAIQQIDPD